MEQESDERVWRAVEDQSYSHCHLHLMLHLVPLTSGAQRHVSLPSKEAAVPCKYQSKYHDLSFSFLLGSRNECCYNKVINPLFGYFLINCLASGRNHQHSFSNPDTSSDHSYRKHFTLTEVTLDTTMNPICFPLLHELNCTKLLINQATLAWAWFLHTHQHRYARLHGHTAMCKQLLAHFYLHF